MFRHLEFAPQAGLPDMSSYSIVYNAMPMQAPTVKSSVHVASDEPVRGLFAIELSTKSWVVGVNTPLSDKLGRYTQAVRMRSISAKSPIGIFTK